ncbi:MAG: DUF1761 domain-containing protein [Beijerinckiaceae bacterium]|nr:DUF1761 domain-containing protein [Beijerinckiaceae bacterium]
MNIDWIAILAAAIASWMFGALWYGLLSKQWMAAIGFTPADMQGPDGKPKIPLTPMIVSFVAEFVMAIILAGVIAHTAKKGVTINSGALVGAICWLGFVITTLATNHAYSKAKAALTIIDGGHWLGVLLIQGIVLGALL